MLPAAPRWGRMRSERGTSATSWLPDPAQSSPTTLSLPLSALALDNSTNSKELEGLGTKEMTAVARVTLLNPAALYQR